MSISPRPDRAKSSDPLMRPGPQPPNQIGTLSEQLELAGTSRPPARELCRAGLLDLLADGMADIALAVMQETIR
jgi:hypothetical protein